LAVIAIYKKIDKNKNKRRLKGTLIVDSSKIQCNAKKKLNQREATAIYKEHIKNKFKATEQRQI
jgi:hypothetical protein